MRDPMGFAKYNNIFMYKSTNAENDDSIKVTEVVVVVRGHVSIVNNASTHSGPDIIHRALSATRQDKKKKKERS